MDGVPYFLAACNIQHTYLIRTVEKPNFLSPRKIQNKLTRNWHNISRVQFRWKIRQRNGVSNIPLLSIPAQPLPQNRISVYLNLVVCNTHPPKRPLNLIFEKWTPHWQTVIYGTVGASQVAQKLHQPATFAQQLWKSVKRLRLGSVWKNWVQNTPPSSFRMPPAILVPNPDPISFVRMSKCSLWCGSLYLVPRQWD